MTAHSRREVPSWLLAGAGVFLLTLAVRLVPAWLLTYEIGDMGVYRRLAVAVRNGDNLYAYPNTFPYTPYSQFIPLAILKISEATGLPYAFVLKGCLSLVDGVTALLILGYLRWRGVAFARSSLWAMAWALNPMSILISAFHGNLMASVPCLVLAAYVSAEVGRHGKGRTTLLAISALLLGLAIAMRTYPVLLLPVFVLLYARTIGEVGAFIALAGLPAVVSSLPYLIYTREAFLHEILAYGGVPDFGWLSVRRSVAHLVLNAGAPVPDVLWARTKELFLGGYLAACLAMPLFRRASFGRALMIAPLLFYALYGGVSAQYLLWVLPFAVILRERLTLPFTILGTAAMVSFYLIYYPGVLTGDFRLPFSHDDRWVWVLNAASNSLLVILSLTWAACIVGAELRGYARTGHPAPVPWLRSLGWLWSSRIYAVVLLLIFAGWLAIAWLAGREAYLAMRPALGSRDASGALESFVFAHHDEGPVPFLDGRRTAGRRPPPPAGSTPRRDSG